MLRKLDDVQEIEFPEDVKKMVDEMYDLIYEEEYEETDHSRLDHWEKLSRRVADDKSGKQSFAKRDSMLLTKETLEGYYANPTNQDKIAGYYKLHHFILNNLDLFNEIDQLIMKINERYDEYLKKK